MRQLCKILCCAMMLCFSSITSAEILLYGIEKHAASISEEKGIEIVLQLKKENRFDDLVAFSNQQPAYSELMVLIRGFFYLVEQQDANMAYKEFITIPDNPLSQFILGRIFFSQGHQKGELYWTKRAAENGFLEAQYHLSILYRDKKEYRNAYVWARCAKVGHLDKASLLVEELSTKLFLKEKQEIDRKYNRSTCKKDTKYDALLTKLGYSIP